MWNRCGPCSTRPAFRHWGPSRRRRTGRYASPAMRRMHSLCTSAELDCSVGVGTRKASHTSTPAPRNVAPTAWASPIGHEGWFASSDIATGRMVSQLHRTASARMWLRSPMLTARDFGCIPGTMRSVKGGGAAETTTPGRRIAGLSCPWRSYVQSSRPTGWSAAARDRPGRMKRGCGVL